jgi:tetratricopeptide (TPR) repeat protein
MTVKLALACATAAVAALGCTRCDSPRPAGPIAGALLALAADFGADAAETNAASARLNEIALAVERHHRRTRADLPDDINAVVFGELGFEREIDSAATRFFQPSRVIVERRGNCLGLGALYLALAERLGVPLDGILLPSHFFVRTPGPAGRNVELLRRGEAMPDAWYRGKYGPWPEPPSAYNRPVTVTELVAIHWYDRANDLRTAGKLADAEQAFARAAQGFPGFAEAHANLGLLRQSRGAFALAAQAYDSARQAWPELPGLARNVEQLERQLASSERR